MTVDLTIKVQNGTVTITVGGQPFILAAAPPAVPLGKIVSEKVLGALPGGAANAASTDPGGAPNAASTDPGGGPNEGTIVIVPIVITSSGGTAVLPGKDVKIPASAKPAEAPVTHGADEKSAA